MKVKWAWSSRALGLSAWPALASSLKGSTSWRLWHMRIVAVTPLALWGHYEVPSGWPEHKHRDAETVGLITTPAAKGRSVHSVETPAPGSVASQVGQSGARETSSRTRNGVRLEACEFFLSATFHLIFSEGSWLWVTETAENESADEGWRGLRCDTLFCHWCRTQGAKAPAGCCPGTHCPLRGRRQKSGGCFRDGWHPRPPHPPTTRALAKVCSDVAFLIFP